MHNDINNCMQLTTDLVAESWAKSLPLKALLIGAKTVSFWSAGMSLIVPSGTRSRSPTSAGDASIVPENSLPTQKYLLQWSRGLFISEARLSKRLTCITETDLCKQDTGLRGSSFWCSSSSSSSVTFMRILFTNTGCALSTVSILWYFITALGMLYYFLLYWHYLAAFYLLFYIILMNEWMKFWQWKLKHVVHENSCQVAYVYKKLLNFSRHLYKTCTNWVNVTHFIVNHPGSFSCVHVPPTGITLWPSCAIHYRKDARSRFISV